ncbi:VOC family protein [Lacimicrobium alkaliphilum]|uniref:Lactoylglutathione lyase n=1 Tax=Lacimicrobium alkaliphilum TaxID=1526571 RepID=A0A0U3AWJ6_9ALTE|nr:VOC family protein [Lacimicrobium alkaliphilum]ALS97336.1 lactoylglutathione lyase [Lacimicrobium alkaliphilum]
MKINPVVHFEIYVQDMDRAKAFYEALFDVKLENMPSPTPEIDMDMWFFPMDKDDPMSGYGAGGMLVKMEGFTPGAGGTLVYFGCDDCAVQAARAAANGGSIHQEKMSIGEHGFCAVVRDSEGNLIGLHSMT